MNHKAALTLICSALLTVPAWAASPPREEAAFDWSQLAGLWAESAEHAYACIASNLHFRFAIAPDRKSLAFKLDRKWKIGTGQDVEEYSAKILAAEGRRLVIRYGPELGTLSPEMAEWELLFIGPGVYRWRSTSWRPGQYNSVIGIRCNDAS